MLPPSFAPRLVVVGTQPKLRALQRWRADIFILVV
jgi:hypothetical protein